MFRSRSRRTAASGAAALAIALTAAACSDGPTAPEGPPPLDISTPGGALVAIQEYYSRRMVDEAVGLLAPGYRFYPAQPESIAFLGPGETSWDHEQEITILDELLVEERSSWIDQVLLEVHTETVSMAPDSSTVDIVAKVELGLLIGADQWEKATSRMAMRYVRNGDGDYLLAEERESVWPTTDLTVGEHKAGVLLGP
jgi:hypothetical protein